MKTLFTLIFATLVTLSFASGDSFFILEENGDNYTLFLQLNESQKYCSLVVEGEYVIDGKTETFTMIVEGNDMDNFADNLARIQDIAPGVTIADYNVTAFCTNGNEYQFPTVSLDFGYNENLAAVTE